MKVGDIKRVKINQEYTCEEAQDKICVIETMIPDSDISIRIQRYDCTHLRQWVKKKHLEDV